MLRQLAMGGRERLVMGSSPLVRRWQRRQRNIRAATTTLSKVSVSPTKTDRTKRLRYLQRFYFSKENSCSGTMKRPSSSVAQVPLKEATDQLHGKEDHIDNLLDGIHPWSLQELVDIISKAEPENPHQLLPLVEDIELRLDRQFSLLNDLQDMIETMSTNRQIAIVSGGSKGSTATPGVVSARGARPIWWTYQEEERLDSELDKIRKNLRDLRVLHRDTHQKCQHLVGQLQRNITATTCTADAKLLTQQMASCMAEVYARHALTMEPMAELVIGLRPLVQPPQLDRTIQAYLQSRLILQLLTDHVVQCIKKGNPTGAVSTTTPISQVVSDAVTEAKHLCEAHFYIVPPIHVVSDPPESENTDNNDDDSILLIQPWLQYTLVELLKNSMAVTVERQRTKHDDNEQQLCSIHIQILDTSDEIQIEIIDQGGGLPDSRSPEELFRFAQASKIWDRLDHQTTYAMPTRSPLQGLGVGLFLSKLMMEQFGGRLELLNRPRTADLQPGLTATITLPKDGSNCNSNV